MEGKQLSAVEAELYDRQIRLWGIESQEKLRAANVLLIGVRALGSEIAKNILLSGINSLTILDDGIITEEERMRNFLLPPDSVGKKIAEEVVLKAQLLNPLVKITADTDSPASKDQSYFKDFTIIVATGIKSDLLLKIDKTCRSNKVKLIYGDVFGMFGFCVSDLQEHNYFEDKVILAGKKRTHTGAEKTTVKVQGLITYPELNKVLVFPSSKQSTESIRKVKRRNELFYVMLTLMEFLNRSNRKVSMSTREGDLKLLQQIKKEIFELYQVDVSKSKLSDDIFADTFGEVAPTCSVVGGVIAQEVIKAVSHKEVPINNVFLFDPVTYDGKEETVAA